MGRDFKTFPGGKGANQSVACARAGGAATHMLLALGHDAFAAPLESSLTQAGVELHIVRVDDQPTGTAFICVSDDAENAITVAPGANLALRSAHLPPLEAFSHLLLQLETPMETVAAYAQAARAQGVKVVLNAAPAQTLPSTLLAQLDVLIVNEGELAMVTDMPLGSIVDALAKLTVPCVVVTLGWRGSCTLADGVFSVQPGFGVAPIDTTGAGDTFCGTLTAALGEGVALLQALQRANAAAALACTRLGAQTSIPTRAEVNDFLASQLASSESQDAALRRYCGAAFK